VLNCVQWLVRGEERVFFWRELLRHTHRRHADTHHPHDDNPRLVKCGHCRYWLRWYDASKGTSQAACCFLLLRLLFSLYKTCAFIVCGVFVKSVHMSCHSRGMLCWRRWTIFMCFQSPCGVTRAVFFFLFQQGNDICSSLAFYTLTSLSSCMFLTNVCTNNIAAHHRSFIYSPISVMTRMSTRASTLNLFGRNQWSMSS
jgi:hypothetical protein